VDGGDRCLELSVRVACFSLLALYFAPGNMNLKQSLQPYRAKAAAWGDALRLAFGGRPGAAVDAELCRKPVILLVCEANIPRLERMIKYLRPLRSEQFVLLCRRSKFRAGFHQAIADIPVYLYENPAQLRALLLQFKEVKLVHAFESRSKFQNIARKQLKAPFIFDCQDLSVIYHGLHPPVPWIRRNLNDEKACLEGADHVIAHSLEYNQAARLYGIPKKPVTFFPFYLDDDAVKERINKPSEEALRMIYLGGLGDAATRNPFNLTLYGKALARLGIGLDVYPSPLTPASITDAYARYAAGQPGFRLCKPVPSNELGAVTARYHYGFIPFFKTAGDQTIGPFKFKYGTTLKMVNYVEAGLGVVCSEDFEWQAWLVKRYGIGIIAPKHGCCRCRFTASPQSMNASRVRVDSCAIFAHQYIPITNP